MRLQSDFTRRANACGRQFQMICGLCLLLGALTVTVFGQTFQGSLRGAVRDSGGQAVAGATLTLTNPATSIARTTVANDSGEYAFERIDPGSYVLTVTREGFKKLERQNVTIETQQQLSLDLQLEIGNVNESVTVTDVVPLIEATNASVGQLVNKQFLDNLPNFGRNPFALTTISPQVLLVGTVGEVRQQDQTASSQISLAGGPVRGNNYLLDGVPIADIASRAVIIPSIEATREVKLQVNSYDAEAGRTGGGLFNLTGRSGENQVHGSIFGFIQPQGLQANTFFANRSGIKRPDAPYKLYGGSLGGPVYIPKVYDGRNKTFFWFASEGYRATTFRTEIFTVPTALERQGDFSQTRNNGQPVVIYDPRTTRPDPNNPGKFIRDPFPGNRIPLNLQDPVGRALANAFPAPNRPGDVNGRNNFAASGALADRADQFYTKLDHNFGSRYQLSGSYITYGSREPQEDYYGTVANPAGSLLLRRVHAVTVNNNFTLNDTTVLFARYGYNTFDDIVETSSAGFDIAQLGFNPAFAQAVSFKKYPRVLITGSTYGTAFRGALGSRDPSPRTWFGHNLYLGGSKLIGRHSLKAGFDYRKLAVEFFNIGQATGEYSFNRAFTQGPDPNVTTVAGGNEIASLLIGAPASANVPISTPISVFVNYFGGYVQDDFRISQKLTLNLGLRYEYEQGLQERDNNLTVGFDPNARFPVQPAGLNLTGGLIFAGVNGAPTQQTRAQKNKWGPRVGFAYQFNDKTTLRGGYGVMWAPPIFSALPTVAGYGALGFSAQTDMVTSLDGGLTPANFLSNPFPNGLVRPTGSSLGLLTQVGQSVSFVDQNRKAAYLQQYSLDLQRELPGNVAVTLAYTGSRGTHLQIGGIANGALNLNQLPPQFLSRTDLQNRVPNPFLGTPAARGLLAGATVQQAQLLRPFPQFGDVLMFGASGGNSFYNSLTIKAQKRLSQGLQFLTSYTWSKFLDNLNGQTNAFVPGAPVNILNANDRRSDYGLSSVDAPHRYLLSFIYELPFGKGKRYGGGINRGADLLLGGWQINGIATYASGWPIPITQAVNNTNAFTLGQRPNLVQNVPIETSGSLGSRIDGTYLNPAAFTVAAPNTFGNITRTLNARTPGFRNWDLSFAKTAHIYERLNVQFRMEAVNAFNTPLFAGPNPVFGTATFGKITAQANRPRLVQLMLRVGW